MISQAEIDRLHMRVWKEGYGSISATEAGFIQSVISAYKPKTFLEIGTASGISTGFIAKFMSQNEGERLISIDLEKRFYVDRRRPTGFLATKIHSGDMPEVDIVRGKDSTCVCEEYPEKKFDAAFIDANHQHPWPTLDMIAVLPAINSHAVVIHHDLALYREQNPVYGIGPKYLYDQMPSTSRVVTSEHRRNIYYIKLGDSYSVLETPLVDSLYIPWRLRKPIPAETLSRFRTIIENYWGDDLLKAFDDSRSKFDHNVELIS